MAELAESPVYPFETIDLDNLPKLDVVVIHGGNIRKDANGNWQSTSLVEGPEKSRGAFSRIIAAAMLYKQGKIDRIIVSTGNTVPSESDPSTPDPTAPTEAAVMKKELIELGIPEEIIEAEETSLNTWQNAEESAAIIRKHDYKKIGILTSAWHMDRTRMFHDEQKLAEEGRELFNIPAEQIVGQDSPGYQELIRQLYASPRMKERIAQEQQGIRDFRSGKYNPRPPLTSSR